MDFSESAIASIDVASSTGEIGPPFAAELRKVLAGVQFSSPIKTIVFFPTLIAPEMGVMRDKITYKRSEPSVFIKINIDYSRWRAADRRDRLELYADALKRGIMQVKSSKLSAEDRGKLLRTINDVELRMASHHPHCD